jgi:hypothetical protein
MNNILWSAEKNFCNIITITDFFPELELAYLCCVLSSLYNSPAGPIETPAFLLLVAMQRNSSGVARISTEVFSLRLPSNDGIQQNTSQY